ncbi:hypothetical protein QAD02_014767 [Eretmocerus hayati]|uniref:Uncharacterized protein n=1 Tax=Eretmocerus hayati TaxID=131215 RepID=A0ACC2P6E5_9HYME|nr:hypothetical protein QAD02_014767 [Eretmocerus hayati]
MAELQRAQSVRHAVVGFADQQPHLQAARAERNQKRALAARYAAWALCLGMLACVLQCAATAFPTWAYFRNPDCPQDSSYTSLGIESLIWTTTMTPTQLKAAKLELQVL